MNIYISSDLHYDVDTGFQSVKKLARFLRQHSSQEDILLLLGDYGNSRKEIFSCLYDLCQNFTGRIIATIGNHDCWNRQENNTDIYRNHVYQTLLNAGVDDILDTTNSGIQLKNNIGIAGIMGWYDYSFGDANIDQQYYTQKSWQNITWGDKIYTHWESSDRELVKESSTQLRSQLSSLKKSGCTKIIVGMHHVPKDIERVMIQFEERVNTVLDKRSLGMNKVLYQLNVAKLHNELLDIHPFIDRNGSTALLFTEFMMAQDSYTPKETRETDYYKKITEIFEYNYAAVSIVGYEHFLISSIPGYYKGAVGNEDDKKTYDIVSKHVAENVNKQTITEKIRKIFKR